LGTDILLTIVIKLLQHSLEFLAQSVAAGFVEERLSFQISRTYIYNLQSH